MDRSTGLLVTARSLTRVVVTGELDVATAPRLAVLLAEPAAVEIDLAGVSFVDASGLTVLVAAREARGRDRLRLVTPSTAVTRILELSGELGAFSVWA